MSHKPIHREAVELLLSSVSLTSTEDGLRASFFFGKPGAPHWERRMGTDIHYRRKELIRAALFVRQNGPAYLRYLSINAIWSMLQTFVSENFWHAADYVLFKQLPGSLAELLPDRPKIELADALAASPIFLPRDELTLFPLSTFVVEADFDSKPFFLIGATSLNADRLPGSTKAPWLVPSQFPPMLDWKGKKWSPSAWLGIRSPVIQAAEKMRAAILGATALTPLHRYRYQFTGRSVIDGRATINAEAGVTCSFEGRHTPPISYDINVGSGDHGWLSLLAEKLVAPDSGIL